MLGPTDMWQMSHTTHTTDKQTEGPTVSLRYGALGGLSPEALFLGGLSPEPLCVGGLSPEPLPPRTPP